jgi:uncharacterized protein YunC (DUF1805 family)
MKLVLHIVKMTDGVLTGVAAVNGVGEIDHLSSADVEELTHVRQACDRIGSALVHDSRKPVAQISPNKREE